MDNSRTVEHQQRRKILFRYVQIMLNYPTQDPDGKELLKGSFEALSDY